MPLDTAGCEVSGSVRHWDFTARVKVEGHCATEESQKLSTIWSHALQYIEPYYQILQICLKMIEELLRSIYEREAPPKASEQPSAMELWTHPKPPKLLSLHASTRGAYVHIPTGAHIVCVYDYMHMHACTHTCVHSYVRTCMDLSICLPVCLSLCLSASLSLCLSVWAVCLIVFPSIHLAIYPSTHLYQTEVITENPFS